MNENLKEEKHALIEFLDRELARMQIDDNRRGITHWAVLVAIAGIGWAALSMRDTPHIIDMATWVYALESTAIVASMLRRCIYGEYVRSDSPRFISTIYIDAALRGEGYNLVLCGGVFTLGFFVLPGGYWLVWIGHFFLWGLPAAFALLGVVMHLGGYFPPVSSSARPVMIWSLRIAQLVGSAMGMAIVVYSVVPYLSGHVTFDISALQAAVLVVAITLLISMYIETASGGRVTQAIHGILVALSFDEIDVATAYGVTETLLLGAKINKVLEKDTSDLAVAITSLNDVIKAGRMAEDADTKGTVERITAASQHAERIYAKLSLKLQCLPLTSSLKPEDLDPSIAELLKKYEESKSAAAKLLTDMGTAVQKS